MSASIVCNYCGQDLGTSEGHPVPGVCPHCLKSLSIPPAVAPASSDQSDQQAPELSPAGDADLVLDYLKTGEHIRLPRRERVVVGREAAGSDVLSKVAQISREHCVVERRNGRVTVTDMGSTHGTFVTKAKLSCSGAPRLLADGALLFLGKECFLVNLNVVEESPAPAAPRPSEIPPTPTIDPPPPMRWHCSQCTYSAECLPDNGDCPMCGSHNG